MLETQNPALTMDAPIRTLVMVRELQAALRDASKETPSREMSLAITKAEECEMWLQRHIALG